MGTIGVTYEHGIALMPKSLSVHQHRLSWKTLIGCKLKDGLPSKRKDGVREHAKYDDQQRTFRPVIPPSRS